ncbi:heme biosynthesis HemY N-terminal domain-containing protein [Devosia rhodophyticola]|uniref:Heme biosynthesis HemY N-terminal domain-containing protein n=1 Tax=Devosia rhodophyticola TaxID=3026423 RepID=A0ABY7Z1Q9_9HYPH|nr:heme biosynthesis HemY N-terminal domain-containing protein [Devosia rhodophyticola]WDR07427.1 heme biosynthesis HemY N-terminal domain-containing protein [Devosia rhodophyticola]
MTRLASWIIGSLVVTALIAWMISLPGTVTLEVANYRMQPRLGTAIFMLMIVAALVIFVWAVVRRVLGTPKYLARRNQEKRKQQGVDALSDAFIALQAGDLGRARSLARDAQSRLPENAAALLLEARADLALGDMRAARQHYRALISNEKTAMAALSGLYEQARTQNRGEAALTFARKALTLVPNVDWASAAVFDDLVRQGAWAQAVGMVNGEPANNREERAQKRRRQAVIETARARENETSNALDALDHALTALKLLPDFVPAALIAARIHINRGETRKAMSLLRRIWRGTGHPDVARLYAHAQPGASAVDRLKRTRELIATPVANRAEAVVMARAAVDAYDWVLAREALKSFVGEQASQGVASLMAEIEEGQSGDQGKAREWLARAVRAPRDPAWTTDGLVSDEWEPVSPVTGKLDAFEWKVPVSLSATRNPTSATPTPIAPPAPLKPEPAKQDSDGDVLALARAGNAE